MLTQSYRAGRNRPGEEAAAQPGKSAASPHGTSEGFSVDSLSLSEVVRSRGKRQGFPGQGSEAASSQQ